jgi:catechol 2,3-dioxygenase-like lactoylglutathione lyase family enzyme
MQIDCLRLASRDPASLHAFYRASFDAQPKGRDLTIGEQRIEIVAAQRSEEGVFAANETGFQHFAIVVADIEAAFARLREIGGWRPISLDGPQRLPEASGGAVAFKFRDPCGHPLELLEFPANATPTHWRKRFAAAPKRLFHGIDHTALTVTDAQAACAFFLRHGFVCAHRQVNSGPEQRRLDGLAQAKIVEVEVLSLAPPDGIRPGIELLAYRQPPTVSRSAADGSSAATTMVISGAALPATRDPDGHRIAVSPGLSGAEASQR